MPRFVPSFLAALLCSTMLAACGSGPDIKEALGVKHEKSAPAKEPVATDLDGSVRQAQSQRLAGQYDDAIHTLSQLMMVAADDPRVVGEYGKTLALKGRASDATQFLRRAIELSPNDWTFYSALGVAYDQLGDQVNARIAYDHALTLHPGEASVLNNYALSRMLANDPAGAQSLMARAEIAGGASDAKIARNIALLKTLSPDSGPGPVTRAIAALTPGILAPSVPAPKPMAEAKSAAPQPHLAAQAPVTNQALPPLPNGAPHPLQPLPQFTQAPARAIAQAPVSASPTVVMQRVPEDPLAGPARPRVATKRDAKTPMPMAAAKAEAVQKAAAKAQEAADKIAAKSDAKPAKVAPAKLRTDAPSKTADKKEPVPSLRLAADARNP